jgi:glycosyltransferase involved in cell wall biosynthesis
MNIALVHDYLIQDGGAERVLQAFHDIWPEAPVFVLLHDRRKMPQMTGWDVRTSFLQDMPFALRSHKHLLPLMPTATESYDLSEYDAVLSSTSAFAKGVITRPDTVHVCYCHTPTRYLWSDTHSYVRENVKNLPTRLAIHPLLSKMRIWDQLAAARVDKFIANSQTVQDRITKYYDRESDIINPPVDTHSFSVAKDLDDYFLAGGRLVPYKRFDLIVEAFNRLGKPVKIFGIGPDLERLRNLSRPNIEFVGKVSDEEKARLYSRAQAYLHPQEEDFGITAVEAMAAGRPVIAYGKGGGAETVKPGRTGIWLKTQSWKELADAVDRFRAEDYAPQDIRAHAKQFDVEMFKQQIKTYMESAVLDKQRKNRL